MEKETHHPTPPLRRGDHGHLASIAEGDAEGDRRGDERDFISITTAWR